MNTFAEILEQADNLTIDEKETLIEILKRRMIDYRRNKLINDIHDAEREFKEGKCTPSTSEEIMRDLI